MKETLVSDNNNNNNSNNMNNSNNSGNNTRSAGVGVASMILGILSLLTFCIPVLGIVLAVLAVILGLFGMIRKSGPKRSLAGFVMGLISLIIGIVLIMTIGGIFNRSNVSQESVTGRAWKRTDDGSVLYLYENGTFIHTDKEGVFSDNFYSGTYVTVPYENSGLTLRNIEKRYDTEYIYDVCLYVDQRVSHGVEIAEPDGKISYLYIFDRKYSSGDTVTLCPHNDSLHADVTQAKETKLIYPSEDNQYIAGIPSEEDSSVTAEDDTRSEIESAVKTETTNEVDTATETETLSETEAATESEAATEMEATTETEVTSEVEAVTEATTASEVEPATESEAATEVEATTETETLSETESETETESESDYDDTIEETLDSLLDELEPGQLEELDDLIEELDDSIGIWDRIRGWMESMWQRVTDYFTNLSL